MVILKDVDKYGVITKSDSVLSFPQMDSSDSELGATGVPPTPPQRNCWLPPSMREAAKAALEARTTETVESPDDGDLAEADQSHEVTDGRGSQVEGASAPEEVAANLEVVTVDSSVNTMILHFSCVHVLILLITDLVFQKMSSIMVYCSTLVL
jgi:hypothetical protein